MTLRRIAYEYDADNRESSNGEERVFVMALPDGPPYVLTGATAVIWEVAMSQPADVAAEVADLMGLTRDQICHDVESTIVDLSSKGLTPAAPMG